MKKQKRGTPQLRGLFRAPAYPHSATVVLTKLRALLEQQLGHHVTFKEIGKLAGKATNTTHYWWYQSLHSHLRGLLCLLEQLPPARRQEFITAACRVYPAIDHPRLAHDINNLRLLFELLQRKSGLTQITDGTEAARTFVLSAIGHALPRMDKLHRPVAGLDLHLPSDLVPVPTMLYLDRGGKLGATQALVERIWPEIEASRAPLLLFNGTWSFVPGKRQQILEWAQTRHVILAEEIAIDTTGSHGTSTYASKILTISTAPSYPGGILISETD